MKKEFQSPEILFLQLQAEDVLTASAGHDEKDNWVKDLFNLN